MTDCMTEHTEAGAEASTAADETQAARLVRVRFEPDRAIFDVVIDPVAPARTSQPLAVRAAELRPLLAQHTCVNARSRAGQAQPLFGEVMDDTPLPHLLEHLAIDVLTEMTSAPKADADRAALPGSGPAQAASARQAGTPAACAFQGDQTFVGTSEWLDRAARTARIQLSCPDDLLVLSAFTEALHLLNLVVVG